MMNKISNRPEQETLNRVKEECFDKYLNISKAERLAHSIPYLYGFRYNAGQEPKLINEYEDYEPLAILLDTAKNNDIETGKTTFPDFICQNGIIEHFKVFASKETKKKGSELMIDYSELDKKIENRFEFDKQNGTLKNSYYEEKQLSKQSYELFCKSFKSNWNNHIESLKAYKKDHDLHNKKVCFLIENMSFGMKMEIKYPDDYTLGIHTGRIIENRKNEKEYFEQIMVGRCKELLQIIYDSRELVDYVICYSDNKHIEIIKTDQTEYIANLLPEYKYHEADTFSVRMLSEIGGINCEN